MAVKKQARKRTKSVTDSKPVTRKSTKSKAGNIKARDKNKSLSPKSPQFMPDGCISPYDFEDDPVTNAIKSREAIISASQPTIENASAKAKKGAELMDTGVITTPSGNLPYVFVDVSKRPLPAESVSIPFVHPLTEQESANNFGTIKLSKDCFHVLSHSETIETIDGKECLLIEELRATPVYPNAIVLESFKRQRNPDGSWSMTNALVRIPDNEIKIIYDDENVVVDRLLVRVGTANNRKLSDESMSTDSLPVEEEKLVEPRIIGKANFAKLIEK